MVTHSSDKQAELAPSFYTRVLCFSQVVQQLISVHVWGMSTYCGLLFKSVSCCSSNPELCHQLTGCFDQRLIALISFLTLCFFHSFSQLT